MGRRRKKNLHLPPRMQLSNGAYYPDSYANGKVTGTRLGKDFGTALQEHGKLVAPVRTGETFNELADRFPVDEEDGLPASKRITDLKKNHGIDVAQKVAGHLDLPA